MDNGAIIEQTDIAVDYWRVQKYPWLKHFFLSHIHSDHTKGLTPSWRHKIYCSEITRKLLIHKIGIKDCLVESIQIGFPKVLKGNCGSFVVTLLDANHCPGSVMFLFEGEFGRVLYTADFRCDSNFLRWFIPIPISHINLLYLDNTYLREDANFPTREEASKEVMRVIGDHPQHRVLIVCYCVGKENLLVEIARTFEEWVIVSTEKFKILEILEMPNVFTTNKNSGRIRVIMARELKNKEIQSWIKAAPTIAIFPTCMFNESNNPYKTDSWEKAFFIPYSDHSSYKELTTFLSYVQPERVVPISKDNESNCLKVARALKPLGFVSKEILDYKIPTRPEFFMEVNTSQQFCTIDEALSTRRSSPFTMHELGRKKSSKVKHKLSASRRVIRRKGVIFQDDEEPEKVSSDNVAYGEPVHNEITFEQEHSRIQIERQEEKINCQTQDENQGNEIHIKVQTESKSAEMCSQMQIENQEETMDSQTQSENQVKEIHGQVEIETPAEEMCSQTWGENKEEEIHSQTLGENQGMEVNSPVNSKNQEKEICIQTQGENQVKEIHSPVNNEKQEKELSVPIQGEYQGKKIRSQVNSEKQDKEICTQTQGENQVKEIHSQVNNEKEEKELSVPIQGEYQGKKIRSQVNSEKQDKEICIQTEGEYQGKEIHSQVEFKSPSEEMCSQTQGENKGEEMHIQTQSENQGKEMHGQVQIESPSKEICSHIQIENVEEEMCSHTQVENQGDKMDSQVLIESPLGKKTFSHTQIENQEEEISSQLQIKNKGEKMCSQTQIENQEDETQIEYPNLLIDANNDPRDQTKLACKGKNINESLGKERREPKKRRTLENRVEEMYNHLRAENQGEEVESHNGKSKQHEFQISFPDPSLKDDIDYIMHRSMFTPRILPSAKRKEKDLVQLKFLSRIVRQAEKRHFPWKEGSN